MYIQCGYIKSSACGYNNYIQYTYNYLYPAFIYNQRGYIYITGIYYIQRGYI